MKKTHTLLLALFLCLALIFPCALAEDAYVPGQRTQALIDAALDAGQIVGGETRLTFQLGDEILSMLSGDEESQAQLDALMEVIGGVRLAGGFGKLEDGYRVELGGSYTAPSGDNVFVTAAANLTLDGVSIESNLIEGERLSIRWETLLRLFGLTDDEVNQIMALRDVDWDNAMEELSTVVAQAAEEIGKLVEPYLATFADFLASLDIQQRDNVAAEGDYPAVDHEISVTCTAEDGATRDYTVHVVRMPAFAGTLPQIGQPEPEDPTPEEPQTRPGPFRALWTALCAPVDLPLNRWLPMYAILAAGLVIPALPYLLSFTAGAML